jgi:hypothetical protein
MEKNVKKLNFRIALLSVIFLQAIPAVHAQSQFMDYFTATPIIGSLSSNCWGAAAVGPRDQSNGLESQNNQYCYWDGGIIKGSDGVYHMYASRWNESEGHMGWFGSVAVHATSNNLYGPYTDRGLCWPNNQNGKGHNVFPFVGGDGNYYIIVADTRPGDIFRATSLDGPWTYVGGISYSGNFGQLANIAILYRPDGRYMAVPRSGVIGISNNNVLGTYVVQGSSAYSQAGVPSGNLEDPVVWYSGGLYHIVVNKWDTRKAYHITSEDGINGWQLSPGLAYDPTANFIRYTDGTVNRWNKLERFNVYMENDHVVAALLSGIDVAKDADGGNDSHGSKVIIVPFDGATFDGEDPTPVPTLGPTPEPIQEPIFSGGPYPLNGTSDYVDLPDGLTNDLYDFSIACWVNLNSLDTWTRVYDFGGDTTIFMMLTPASGNTGNPYFCITLAGNDGEQGLNGTSALPTGSWQHIAITKSGNTGILYINGQEVDRNTNMTLYPAEMGNTTNNYIGRSQWEQDPYLNGEVDEFYVYNRAISTSEVADLANSQTITPEPTATSTPAPTVDLGDANGDGAIDIVDALLIAQYYVGLDPAGFIPGNADTNCDGSIDIVDALLVAQYYVGLITSFSC